MKTQQLCKDYLRLYQKGCILDPVEAAQGMNLTWDIRVDWHQMAYVLDEMTRYDEASEQGRGPDRMTRYLIN